MYVSGLVPYPSFRFPSIDLERHPYLVASLLVVRPKRPMSTHDRSTSHVRPACMDALDVRRRPVKLEIKREEELNRLRFVGSHARRAILSTSPPRSLMTQIRHDTRRCMHDGFTLILSGSPPRTPSPPRSASARVHRPVPRCGRCPPASSRRRSSAVRWQDARSHRCSRWRRA